MEADPRRCDRSHGSTSFAALSPMLHALAGGRVRSSTGLNSIIVATAITVGIRFEPEDAERIPNRRGVGLRRRLNHIMNACPWRTGPHNHRCSSPSRIPEMTPASPLHFPHPPQADRTSKPKKAVKPTPSPLPSHRSHQHGPREVSDKGRAMQVATAALKQTPKIRADKVAELKAPDWRWTYQFPGADIAERMLADDLWPRRTPSQPPPPFTAVLRAHPGLSQDRPGGLAAEAMSLTAATFQGHGQVGHEIDEKIDLAGYPAASSSSSTSLPP